MLSTTLPHRVLTSLKDLGVQLLANYGQTGSTLPKTRLVVAFSGGMDSTMLLDSLAQLRSQFNLEIFAAYYNHQWRPGAPRELPILHKTTETLQIPLIIIEADRTIPKTETVARAYRYKAFCQLAKDLDAKAVVTAHHADDQIETVLFRILRGTGLDGLVGIQRAMDYRIPSRNAEGESSVKVIRPLLGVSKIDIIEYIKERQLRYYDDPSNDNTKIQRNLIRKKILPDLQQNFPHVKNALYKISLLAEGDHEILEKSLADIWGKIYLSDEKGYYLDSTQFTQLELPYQRRILKRYFSQTNMEFDFQIIEDTLSFIRGEHRQDLSIGLKSMSSHKNILDKVSNPKMYDRGRVASEKALNEHYFLSLYKNKLRVIRLPESALKPPKTMEQGRAESVIVPIPGSVYSPELKLNIEITQIPEELKVKLSKPAVLKASALLDPNVAYMDLSLFIDSPERPEAPKPLELRSRRSGDKFLPMGMNAPMRLKKFLINKGIPRFERDNLPMLASGNHILWIPGHGLSDYVKVTGKPTHRIQVEVSSANAEQSTGQETIGGSDETLTYANVGAKPAEEVSVDALVAAMANDFGEVYHQQEPHLEKFNDEEDEEDYFSSIAEDEYETLEEDEDN